MISVVDYGVANLGSILNMLKKIGAEARPASTPDCIANAESIILPGVGAFDPGVTALAKLKLVEPLRERVLEDKIQILGICLGMQLLGNSSEEGKLHGLGLIDGHCERFGFSADSRLKIPHMGWNVLSRCKESDILRDLGDNARFYFAHSYHFVCSYNKDILATANYGGEFAAMVQLDNITGAQFHPEKSHRYGMALLRNFAGL